MRYLMLEGLSLMPGILGQLDEKLDHVCLFSSKAFIHRFFFWVGNVHAFPLATKPATQMLAELILHKLNERLAHSMTTLTGPGLNTFCEGTEKVCIPLFSLFLLSFFTSCLLTLDPDRDWLPSPFPNPKR